MDTIRKIIAGDTPSTSKYHSTDPIVTDVGSGTENRPHTINKQGMTQCSCAGNESACVCAPNTCACEGCGNKSRDNPTRHLGPEPGMGARAKYDEGGGKVGMMSSGGGKDPSHCRKVGMGECGCAPGECVCEGSGKARKVELNK